VKLSEITPRNTPPVGGRHETNRSYNVIINAPDGTSHVYGRDGTAYMSKILNGRLVIDVPPEVFRTLLLSQQGKAWEDINQGRDAWRYLTPGGHY
jgi:hypothetical protein